jgi:hypothetical protein
VCMRELVDGGRIGWMSSQAREKTGTGFPSLSFPSSFQFNPLDDDRPAFAWLSQAIVQTLSV